MTEDPTPPEGAEPSEIAAAVHARVRRIAERVMWDHVAMDLTSRLASTGPASEAESAPHMLAALLSELGSEVADALPEQAARAATQLRTQLDLQGLQHALTSRQVRGPEQCLDHDCTGLMQPRGLLMLTHQQLTTDKPQIALALVHIQLKNAVCFLCRAALTSPCFHMSWSAGRTSRHVASYSWCRQATDAKLACRVAAWPRSTCRS